MPQFSPSYGVARIRCHEKGLLDRDRMARLIDGTASDAVRQLVDAGYGSMPDATIADADRLIESELQETYQLVREVSFRPEITNLFLMRADVHNLKTLLKLRLTESGEAPVLLQGGVYPIAELETMVRTADYRALPKEFSETLARLEQNIQNGAADPAALSIALDNAHIAYALRTGDEFTKEYFKVQADFNNVLTLLRMRAMHADAEKLRAALLTEGYISHSKLIGGLDAPMDTLGKSIGTGPARWGILRGMEAIIKNGSISAMEKERDNTLLQMVSAGKLQCDTILPVIGYLLAREQEARCLRLILTAKRNNLPDAIIIERLRELYG
ncbi:MAG: V-type ATPase subunit [Eubacteriales bacterium]|nr:V-type ATPase subunit [Eubacteriales bacterium]